MAFLFERPCVVIGGAARSCTTMLGDVVAAHPDAAVLLEERLSDVVRGVERLASIRARPEEAARSAMFGEAVSLLSSRSPRIDEAMAQLAELDGFRARFAALFGEVFGLTCERPGARLVGSKLPFGDPWEDLAYLRSRLGDLRLLLIVRNPIDVVSSSLARARKAERGEDVWPIRTVEAAVEQWLDGMAKMRAILQRRDLPVAVVKFETLCASPEVECARIIAFLDLSPLAEAAAIPREAAPDRQALDAQAWRVLRRQFGDIDAIWPDLSPKAAIEHFGDDAIVLEVNKTVGLSESGFGWLAEHGFSSVEPWGRWTDGPAARLRLRHDPDWRGDLELGVALTWGDAAPVTLCVNGGPAEDAKARSGEPLRVRPRPQELRPDGLLTLDIAVRRPKTPQDAPTSETRRLGLGISTIRLLPDGG